MTQKEKQLLLQVLSAMLPYGVVINYNGLARPLFNISPTQHFQITLDNALDGEHNGLVYISLDVDGEEPKPYLRPMSSMTEEECDMVEEILGDKCIFDFMNNGDIVLKQGQFSQNKLAKLYDYYTSIHVDYRGLIPKGLALESTEGMYN